jgi:TolA-binding protein
MKRTERHHLKENELERWTREAREMLEARGRDALVIVVALIVIGGGALGYYTWRQRVQSNAQQMLAEAEAVLQGEIVQPPPGQQQQWGTYPNERARSEAALARFNAAADAYPSTDAGLYARYQQCSMLVTLGRPDEAVTCYGEVIKRAGNGVYVQMARLGTAEAQARAGRFDQAISVFKELAQQKDTSLPLDGILMQLGRAYMDSGKSADARQTFNRLVEEFPDSAYASEARQELEELPKT